ncbi:DUF1049 domain-containing protein [Altererythrobacter aurantiacus]|uniref:DUF1049 domain-containing protein n=1 Tax=Parapontixanthobacter aurantiacus TaxID=1463599 RepID=A0A844ZED5_9SPHN|nr:LapA family protein [Parapontixanthobacter aurantiacus]MXO85516.1 DUF1049 domain-containing protein [Parapontixanthobacter aurantiacus]
MQIIRTILWLLILAALLLFSWANWSPGVTVRIWEGIVVDTRLPAVVLLSFLAGLVPMWLYHRGVKWRLSRRMKALEEATRVSAISPSPSPVAPTTDEPALHDRDDAGATATPNDRPALP